MAEKLKNELSPEQQSAWDRGVEAAQKALSSSDKPIMMLDELPGISMESDVEAMGWNSVWASEENSARFKQLKH
ncbi:hypothetical protein HNW13_017460 [Shewanella sp. BF02_Schw]|uniref:hypothetical protein n=1 Tax=Shewanella sp. BF02_Schw TaxID=394908 RepID=UPI00177DE668|nr:hypothetical protein [Shewanella sp. BF02_Schw]MBO1897527.1 hypothetical protein [Shewanella sp. BF02_Schw]